MLKRDGSVLKSQLKGNEYTVLLERAYKLWKSYQTDGREYREIAEKLGVNTAELNRRMWQVDHDRGNKSLRSGITKSLDDQVLAAVAQGGSLVSLRDLGTKMGTSPATLFAAVNRLRQAGKLTASGYEGRFGAGEEDQRWLMPEAGSHPIGYVSLRR